MAAGDSTRLVCTACASAGASRVTTTCVSCGRRSEGRRRDGECKRQQIPRGGRSHVPPHGTDLSRGNPWFPRGLPRSRVRVGQHGVGCARSEPGSARVPWASRTMFGAGLEFVSPADVAELVDAHGSGPCGGNPVEVQVLHPLGFRPAADSWTVRFFQFREHPLGEARRFGPVLTVAREDLDPRRSRARARAHAHSDVGHHGDKKKGVHGGSLAACPCPQPPRARCERATFEAANARRFASSTPASSASSTLTLHSWREFRRRARYGGISRGLGS